MAEINTDNGSGGRKKNKQKKMSVRVDFTPMVDMNMLLIIFFMLSSTLSKPKTMEIVMPSKDKVTNAEKNKVKESSAITLLLGANNKVYYFFGKEPTDPKKLIETDFSESGLRQLLLSRNVAVNQQIAVLKDQLKKSQITDDVFKKKSTDIKNEGSLTTAPTVMISPSVASSYNNLVEALDEMQICNIPTYAIVDITNSQEQLLFKRTGNAVYTKPFHLK